jgi:hypothetical protein
MNQLEATQRDVLEIPVEIQGEIEGEITHTTRVSCVPSVGCLEILLEIQSVK